MILSLWVVLVAFSLILIGIGLFRPSESFQAIIGFFFLFLLSFQVLNGTLEYKTGEAISTNYTSVNGTMVSSSESVNYQYAEYSNNTIGYWMVIGSALGLIGLLFSIGRTKLGQE